MKNNSDGFVKTVVHIEGKLVWKWFRTKRGSYIAVCDPLGQTVQAEGFKDLIETMNEALHSTFVELFSSGDLEEFLEERGWSSRDLPVAGEKKKKNVRFEMPFDLKGVRKRDFEEALC